MLNKNKKENLKLSTCSRGRGKKSYHESGCNKMDFSELAKFLNSIYNDTNTETNSPGISAKKPESKHQLTLCYNDDERAIKIINHSDYNYNRSIRALETLFLGIVTGKLQAELIEKSLRAHELDDFFEVGKLSNLLFASTIDVLEGLIKKALISHLDYCVNLGFSANISLELDDCIDALLGICVKDILEILLPLLVGCLMDNDLCNYISYINVDKIISLIESKNVTKEALNIIKEAYSNINNIKRNGKMSSLSWCREFYNNNVFGDWDSYIMNWKFSKAAPKTCSVFVTDVDSPSFISYTEEFFHEIISKVLFSKLIILASEGKLKLSFSSFKENKN